MDYRSVIRLLHHADIDTEQAGSMDIGRIKKQLNAEFAMTASGILNVEEISYNKHDVFEELEREDFANRMSFHNLIWDHKELLDLLEQDSIDINASYEEWFYLHDNEEFVTFLSPYFSGAYNSVMKTLMQLPDFEQATRWLQFDVFLLPEDEEKAFEGLRIFLDENIHMFRNINKDNYYSHLSQLRIWENEPWGIFINQLPDALFYYIDEVGISIINITARLQTQEKKMCLKLSTQLLKLTKISPDNRRIIEKNHDIYHSQVKGKTGSAFMQYPGAFIMAIIFILKMIMGTSTCNTPSEVIPYQYNNNANTTSLMNSRDSNVRRLFDTSAVNGDAK